MAARFSTTATASLSSISTAIVVLDSEAVEPAGSDALTTQEVDNRGWLAPLSKQYIESIVDHPEGGRDTGESRTSFDLSMFMVRAASTGDLKNVKICVEGKKLSVNSADECGRSSFYWACANGHMEVVLYLIKKGCSNKERPYSPFYAAASKGHIPVLQFLIDEIVDASTPSNDFEKAYIIRACINKTNEDGETPLFVSVSHGHLPVVQYLVELGADLDAVNKRGLSALRAATEKGYLTIMEYLIDKGAEVSLADKDGLTPLHRSARKGNVDMVTLLLTRGADLNCKDRWSSPPLGKTRKEPVQRVIREEEVRRAQLSASAAADEAVKEVLAKEDDDDG